MRFAQPFLLLFLASVVKGLPIALDGRIERVRTIDGDTGVTASETHSKVVASTSIAVTLVRTPRPEATVSTRSSSTYIPSTNIPRNNTTTENLAGMNNLATDSVTTFLKATSIFSAPHSNPINTNNPSSTKSCLDPITTHATIAEPPTGTTSGPNLTPIYLSCPNITSTTSTTSTTTTNSNNNDNDKLVTQIYQFKLLATILGVLYTLVQLCETQVLSKTGRFILNILKTIYSRGKRSINNTTSWLKKIPHPSRSK